MATDGEFRGAARWATSFDRSIASPQGSRLRDTGIAAGGEDPGQGEDGLGSLLASIADEVHRHTAAAREGVMMDFAARVAHARRHLSPALLGAALRALRDQRKTALALITQNAALELATRRNAAVAAFGWKATGAAKISPRIA
jgi:hypothetical protein